MFACSACGTRAVLHKIDPSVVIPHAGMVDEIKQICLSKLFIKEAYPRYNPNMLSRAGGIWDVRVEQKSRCTGS